MLVDDVDWTVGWLSDGVLGVLVSASSSAVDPDKAAGTSASPMEVPAAAD